MRGGFPDKYTLFWESSACARRYTNARTWLALTAQIIIDTGHKVSLGKEKKTNYLI